MVIFKGELNNGLAVESAFEELQDSAEKMVQAIDDMKSMEILDEKTRIEGSYDESEMYVAIPIF